MTQETPIPVGSYFTTASGLTIHYHVAGEASPDRPSIVMLHGSGPGASGYTNFKDNMAFLGSQGYHLIVPDYIGYGLSSKPADFQYRVENQVAVLRELLAELGVGKVVLVGNSLGGWFAMHHALHYPGEVAKLILMAPGGLEQPADFAGGMEGLKEMFRLPSERDFSVGAMRGLFNLFMFEPGDTPDIVLEERLQIAREQPMEVYTTLGGDLVTPDLARIAAPTLVFWGYHDKFLPYRHATYLLDGLPDVRLITSNRAGHWFMIEHADLFNRECLAFIEGED